MATLVEMHHNTIGLDLDHSAGFHKLAIQLFRRRLGEAMKLRGQPAVAAIGQDSQGNVEIGVETHLAGQVVEMKKVDADAVLNGGCD